MQFLSMYAFFTVSCAIILFTLTKKKMTVARTVFAVIALYVGVCTLFLRLLETHVSEHIAYNMRLETITSYMLFLSGVVFNLASVTIVIAAVLSFVFAVKKIVNFLAKRPFTVHSAHNFFNLPQRSAFFTRKFFILFCRLLD